MTNQKQIGLITFGLGGHHEYPINPVEYIGKDKTTKVISNGLSGYCKPNNFEPKQHHENALVLDRIDILFEYPYLAIKCPLCRNDAKGINECPEPDPIFAEAVKDNQFGSLLSIHNAFKKKGEPGPLDTVNIADFYSWWKSYGARTGKVINGQIVWDKPKEKEIVNQTQLNLFA